MCSCIWNSFHFCKRFKGQPFLLCIEKRHGRHQLRLRMLKGRPWNKTDGNSLFWFNKSPINVFLLFPDWITDPATMFVYLSVILWSNFLLTKEDLSDDMFGQDFIVCPEEEKTAASSFAAELVWRLPEHDNPLYFLSFPEGHCQYAPLSSHWDQHLFGTLSWHSF